MYLPHWRARTNQCPLEFLSCPDSEPDNFGTLDSHPFSLVREFGSRGEKEVLAKVYFSSDLGLPFSWQDLTTPRHHFLEAQAQTPSLLRIVQTLIWTQTDFTKSKKRWHLGAFCMWPKTSFAIHLSWQDLYCLDPVFCEFRNCWPTSQFMLLVLWTCTPKKA